MVPGIFRQIVGDEDQIVAIRVPAGTDSKSSGLFELLLVEAQQYSCCTDNDLQSGGLLKELPER